MLQRLLLLPLLAPLLAVLLVGALNPRPATSLRLLIWTSPALPIGLWIAAAAGGGAALSAGATALALKGESRVVVQRRRRGTEPPARQEPWDLPRNEPSRRREAPDEASERGRPFAAAAGPVRAAGDPAPTVAIPFRVIRRADSGMGAAGASAAATGGSGTGAQGFATAAATAAGDAGGDGWEAPPSDDW